MTGTRLFRLLRLGFYQASVPASTLPVNSGPQNTGTSQAFVLQPLGTWGNAGRNTVTSPGIFNIDSALLKNFNFTERYYLQLRFESFNTLNHPNFDDPNTTLTSATFGQISNKRAQLPMRELQLSLKLVF
jgi:hypothetical protein